MTDERAAPEMLGRVASAFGFGGDAPGPEETTTARGEAEEDSVLGEQASEEQESTDDGLDDLIWDNQTLRVPKSLKDAALKHQSMDADYTKKMQELGEQRRMTEQAKSLADTQMLEFAFRQSIPVETQELAIIDAWLETNSNLDIRAMSAEDRLNHIFTLGRAEKRKADVEKTVEAKRAKFSSERQAKISELRNKAREIASKSIPGFGEETEKAMRDYAKSKGLTDQEFDNAVLDSRVFTIFEDGAQLVKIRAGTTKVSEKVERVLKPGVAGNKMPAETAAKLNFGKAMSKATTSGQKAAVIEDRLAKVFTKGRK